MKYEIFKSNSRTGVLRARLIDADGVVVTTSRYCRTVAEAIEHGERLLRGATPSATVRMPQRTLLQGMPYIPSHATDVRKTFARWYPPRGLHPLKPGGR